MAKLITFLAFFLILIIFTPSALAHEGHVHASSSFITVVNPQRIAEYTKNYMESFQAEWKEIQSRNLRATWPVTYDVLLKPDFVKALKALPDTQELGLFLEINPQIAKDSGVTYNTSDSWHRANSLFLSGYTQADRKKLIDTYFSTFKKEFGYYPKSVGAWWVDAYSLDYMQKKYGITGVLGMSDQYNLDGYSLWGTWWSAPYYPSKFNAAVPAQTEKNKLPVVTQRWAPREPLNGYKADTDLKYKYKSEVTPSLFSLQDYSTLELPDTYFKNLLEVYAIKKPYNAFGHAVIGLEGDLAPEDYKTYYANRLDILKNLEHVQEVQIVTMKDFSEWYMLTFPNLSPVHIVASQDLTGNTQKEAVWIQSPMYRIGIVSDPDTKTSQVVDLRAYNETFEEPYYFSPNKNFSLSINLPFLNDSVIEPETAKNLNLGNILDIEEDKITFEKGDIAISNNSIKTPSETLPIPNSLKNLKGVVFHDFSFTIPFTIKRRFPFPLEPFLIGGIIIAAAIISLVKKRMIVMLLGFTLALGILSVVLFPDSTFYISPTEMDGLKVLKEFKKGRVLVYDKDCINCTFESVHKPAAMAGKKGYVKNYSGKDTVIDMSFVLAKDSASARKILKDKGITYVYLARYEGYIESLPYLPEDLNLKRVYENANTEIYKLK